MCLLSLHNPCYDPCTPDDRMISPLDLPCHTCLLTPSHPTPLQIIPKQYCSSSSSAHGNGANGKHNGSANGTTTTANQHHPFPMRPHYGVNNVNNPNNNNPSVDVEALLKVFPAYFTSSNNLLDFDLSDFDLILIPLFHHYFTIKLNQPTLS